MAGDTPHFYVAEDFLIPPAHPDAGVVPVAAYAPGDLVHPADVDTYGWHGKVTRPPAPQTTVQPEPPVPDQEPQRPAPAATPDDTTEE